MGERKGLIGVLIVIVVGVLAYFGIDVSQFNEPIQVDPVPIEESAEGDFESDVASGDDLEGFSSEPIEDGTLIEDVSTGGAEDNLPAEDEFVGDAIPNLYEIYFTNPTCPPEEERVGGIDEYVADDIRAAQTSIDIAAFDLDSHAIIDALVEASKNGVEVRMVTDDEHNPDSTTNRLRRNGISVVEDQRSGLMHNKFVIIDSQILWMGSLNFTMNGVFCNNNNLVRWDAAPLASNYTIEFEEMFVDRQFGPRSPKNTTTRLTIGDVQIENHFSAEASAAAVTARVVARADEEILFLAFSFTSEDVGEAMIERAEAGLDVRGVFEKVGSDASYSYYNDFRRTKLDNLQVLKDANSRIMHHKVIVLDRETVIFGSFNFTNSGDEKNDENMLIVTDPIFASFFVEEFETVWLEAGGE